MVHQVVFGKATTELVLSAGTCPLGPVHELGAKTPFPVRLGDLRTTVDQYTSALAASHPGVDRLLRETLSEGYDPAALCQCIYTIIGLSDNSDPARRPYEMVEQALFVAKKLHAVINFIPPTGGGHAAGLSLCTDFASALGRLLSTDVLKGLTDVVYAARDEARVYLGHLPGIAKRIGPDFSGDHLRVLACYLQKCPALEDGGSVIVSFLPDVITEFRSHPLLQRVSYAASLFGFALIKPAAVRALGAGLGVSDAVCGLVGAVGVGVYIAAKKALQWFPGRVSPDVLSHLLERSKQYFDIGGIGLLETMRVNPKGFICKMLEDSDALIPKILRRAVRLYSGDAHPIGELPRTLSGLVTHKMVAEAARIVAQRIDPATM